MGKIVLICSILVSFMFSSEINWINSYKNALEESKKSDKPILMLVDNANCYYCRLLKRDVLSNKIVSNFINDNFIFLKVNKNEENYPKEKFTIQGTPTTFFIDKTGKMYVSSIIGYVEKEKYLKYLNIAFNKWKR